MWTAFLLEGTERDVLLEGIHLPLPVETEEQAGDSKCSFSGLYLMELQLVLD
jgi:hypothetical protein